MKSVLWVRNYGAAERVQEKSAVSAAVPSNQEHSPEVPTTMALGVMEGGLPCSKEKPGG